jgi:MFS family permease
LVIVLFGLGICFFVNAVSYVAVLIGLAMMRVADLHRTPPVERARGQVRDGLRYVWRTPPLRNTLIAMAVIGIFAYNFSVTLALLAKVTFHGGAGTYALLTSCMGVGAIIGGLFAAHRAKPTPRLLHTLALVFGVLLCGVAFAPSLVVVSVVIVFMGAASIGFIATANATLQLQAEPAMRGRVMSLYAMAFLGSTPIGAPLVGAIAQWSNPRIAIAVGGVATVLAVGVLSWRHGTVGAGKRRPTEAAARAAEVRAVIEVESNIARPA